MATYSAVPISKTFEAGGDLSSAQYRFVKLSSGAIVKNDVAGGPALGVLQDAPNAAGKVGSVALLGPTKITAGAAIAAGAYVASDNQGKAVTATDAAVDGADVTGSHVQGIALEAAAADGDIIEILRLPIGLIPTEA